MGALIAGYVTGILMLHMPIGNMMSVHYETPLGTLVIRDWAVPIGIACLMLLAVLVWRQWRNGVRRDITLFYWFVYVLVILFIYRMLMVHPVEIAHFPEYGFLAVMIGSFVDPTREKFLYGPVLFATVVLGTFDEFFQYFYHCPGYCRYFDFTDTWMNVVAAGGGALFYYGFRTPPSWKEKPLRSVLKSPGPWIVTAFVACLVILNAGGRLFISPPQNIPPGGIFEVAGKSAIFLAREPEVFGTWQKTFHTGTFYVVPPSWGTFLIIVTYLFFAAFDPRYLRRWGLNPALGRRLIPLKRSSAGT